jgi:dCTP deaminase
MVLSDRDICDRIQNGGLVIEPFERACVEPASVDLHLGTEFRRALDEQEQLSLSNSGSECDGINWEYNEHSIVVAPDDFVLATTRETVSIPDDIVARVTGRSSLGRLGISIHQTAGYIDPGFEGQITLEIGNCGPAPIELSSGDRVCQISFTMLSSSAEQPYDFDKSYQGQDGAVPSSMQF